jgi:hypothetical protein
LLPGFPARSPLRILASLAWVAIVIPCTGAALWFFFLLFLGSSIGVDDGASRLPFFLLITTPLGGLIFLVGGIWFICKRL